MHFVLSELKRLLLFGIVETCTCLSSNSHAEWLALKPRPIGRVVTATAARLLASTSLRLLRLREGRLRKIRESLNAPGNRPDARATTEMLRTVIKEEDLLRMALMYRQGLVNEREAIRARPAEDS
jgi:hypothetical protein